MKSLWLGALASVALLALTAVAVWPFFGQLRAWQFACGGLLFLGLLHFYQLHKLARWLKGPLDAPVPQGFGAWDAVFAGLHRRVRIRAEQQHALANAVERFRRAGEALPDGVLILNRHKQIDAMNAKGASHLGLDQNRDRGQTVTNLVRHPDFVAYLAVGRYDEPLIIDSDRLPGQKLLLQLIPYGDEQTLLMTRDVSQLERLETMRRDFVANVSHELKTPLTVVSGFVEMLADSYQDFGPEAVTRYLGLIHEQSERMRRLIDDLLVLSALETGSPRPVEEQVDVHGLLQQIHRDTQALSQGRHDIRLELSGPSCISACSNELRSAFGNLASNAVRYTPAGGRITLEWALCRGSPCFTVSDTGIGVAREHIPRLTERFYRVDRSRSRETGGTGLGLAIVKHVLTRHQGNLEIESELGKGSRFRACLPTSRVLPATISAPQEALQD